MRIVLLTAAALLLSAVAVATPPETKGEFEVVSVSQAKAALEAYEKLFDIFTADIFDDKDLAGVLDLFGKTLSFASAILGFFGGGGESDELKFMRVQFAEVHAKLDSIGLQLGDVKQLIEWSSTRVMYSRLEQHITTSGELFNLYLKTSNNNDKNIRRDQFVREFTKESNAALKLYQAIVDKTNVISENLAAAAVAFTKNHKRKVMSFLLSMHRLILRGAQMQIAYQRIVRSESSAKLIERDWKDRMNKLGRRMNDVNTEVKNRWNAQMKSDVSRFVLEQRGLSNRDFSGAIYRFLADKFHWRNWLSVIYKDVSGFDNHAYAVCDGNALLRTHGSRNVIVASASKSTRFSKSKATGILQKVDGEVRRRYAKDFVDRISHHLGNYCTDAAARIAVCWGCDVWYTGIGSRIAYRKMNAGGKYMNVVVFG